MNKGNSINLTTTVPCLCACPCMLPLVQQSHSNEFNLILGSGSARRISLFNTMGFKFTVVRSNFPENLEKSQFPTATDYVRATSKGKLDALLSDIAHEANQVVVVCDTVVVRESDGAILEKPSDYQEAFCMLESLLDQCIKVVSVVWLHCRETGRTESFHEVTEIQMRSAAEIGSDAINGYLQDPSINYTDLAGGWAVQSSGMVFVKSIKGCYHNIMGFPMSSFYQHLTSLLKH